MTRFLHCSDIHITADYRALPLRRLGWRRIPSLAELYLHGRASHYAQAAQTVRRIFDEAQAHGAGHVMVTGDLTAYALDEEFEGAHAAMGPWASEPGRCSVIPGNHDTYTPESVRSRPLERWFGPLMRSDFPEYAVEDGFPFVKRVGTDAVLIGLRSADVPLLPGFSWGRVGRAQLDALGRLIRDVRLAGRARLVMVHHAPLNAKGRPDKPLHGLRDAQELLAVLPPDGTALFHGHIHRRYHHPATAQRPHLVGAGSSTMAGRAGYWLVDVEDGRFTRFERVDLDVPLTT